MADETHDRTLWVDTLTRIVEPVLGAAAQGRLRETMPIEAHEPGSRRPFTMLEAVGRTLVGLAPWLGCELAEGEEARQRDRLIPLAHASILDITDPASPDYGNWSDAQGRQPIVDAAFLAHALLRAPAALWHPLTDAQRDQVIACLRAIRSIRCHMNNWLLFGAMVEAALFRFAGDYDTQRVAFALEMHEQWYLGDGVYGDGPPFHADYYNSFVISPMMLDVLEVFAGQREDWDALRMKHHPRAKRGAALLERLIGPEGAYPPVGRSLCYRVGAFQLLSQMALRRELPEELSPAQVRCALSAVIRRQFAAPGTFDDAGFLRLGMVGAQPGLAERYISTASTYLCTTGFLALGLPPADPFWADPPADWTAKAIWSGADRAADYALRES